jgi:hypothetical protein
MKISEGKKGKGFALKDLPHDLWGEVKKMAYDSELTINQLIIIILQDRIGADQKLRDAMGRQNYIPIRRRTV